MKVLTLKAHGNCHGDQYEKAVGDIYDHPAPKPELTLGNVTNADQGKADGDAGNRAQAVTGEKRDSKKQDAESPKASRGASRKKG